MMQDGCTTMRIRTVQLWQLSDTSSLKGSGRSRRSAPPTASYVRRSLVDNVVLWPDLELGEIFMAIFGEDKHVMLAITTSTGHVVWNNEHGFHRDHHVWFQLGFNVFTELHTSFATIVWAHHTE